MRKFSNIAACMLVVRCAVRGPVCRQCANPRLHRPAQYRQESTMVYLANPMMNVYRAQVAGTRQIVDAALAGLDRIEHLTMKTLREAAGDQFEIAESVSRALGSTEGNGLAQLQSDAEPAAQRLARCQRDIWAALAEMNGNVAKAYGGWVHDLNSALADSAAGLTQIAPQSQPAAVAGGGNPWAWYEGALRQWQAMSQQVVEASREMAGAAESAEATSTARHAGKRKAES
jgi:hypothetical protein